MHITTYCLFRSYLILSSTTNQPQFELGVVKWLVGPSKTSHLPAYFHYATLYLRTQKRCEEKICLIIFIMQLCINAPRRNMKTKIEVHYQVQPHNRKFLKYFQAPIYADNWYSALLKPTRRMPMKANLGFSTSHPGEFVI